MKYSRLKRASAVEISEITHRCDHIKTMLTHYGTMDITNWGMSILEDTEAINYFTNLVVNDYLNDMGGY